MEASSICGISSMATRQVLAALSKAFEQASGWVVSMESVGGVDAARRVQAGEPFDVVFLASDALDKLIASGHLEATTKTDLMRSQVSMAVRTGAARPAIDSGHAVKRAILAAPSVSYSTGPSGQYLEQLFARWGIAEQVKAKLIVPPPGQPVGALVASGTVALGFQQRSEFIGLSGVDVIGDLPPDIAHVTIFSAAATTRTLQREAVKRMLAFMRSPQSANAKQAHGMQAV